MNVTTLVATLLCPDRCCTVHLARFMHGPIKKVLFFVKPPSTDPDSENTSGKLPVIYALAWRVCPSVLYIYVSWSESFMGRLLVWDWLVRCVL